ncbi:ankyrin repeat domain-containing protein [Hymenobacter sp. BT175]|uniref:ankyrin repeat domain-containing protein n=1 Tax=Hymenobacter translucens TaxID=2886507 RepID=UPI001D0EFFD2|nr:ankyrin repeat domain-containing protein [Hymenobacter translucens]MCC2546524.1 ankyrin repeat domain-containing protein [Hymenobacter translucens]
MKKALLLLALLFSIASTAFAQNQKQDLYKAVAKNNAAEVAALLKAGADPNVALEIVPGFKTSYLITAANHGNLEIVKSLVGSKAQVNWQDQFHGTALMAAAGKGHKAVVEFLLSSGADAKLKDDDGKDALAAARESGNAEVVALLQKHS